MIRQTFSCDICGADKKESNHWFVAMERDGEIRIGTWAALGRRRRGALHLCGQKCLYKLVDDFFVRRAPGARGLAEADVAEPVPAESTGAPLVSEAAVEEWESSARLIATPSKPTRVNHDLAPALSTAKPTKAAAVCEPAKAAPRKPLRELTVAPVAAIAHREPIRAQEILTPVAVSAPASYTTGPVHAMTDTSLTRAVASSAAARIEAKPATSLRPAPADRRRSSAWQRERDREMSATSSRSAASSAAPASSRFIPSRIEARLHPILRTRTAEA